jgi:hypothetical protein
VLSGRAICVPFRARRHRFTTVNRGHSRFSDLRTPYYRCAATRMVRMGSLTLADNGDVMIDPSVFSRIGPEHTSHGMDVVLRIPLA